MSNPCDVKLRIGGNILFLNTVKGAFLTFGKKDGGDVLGKALIEKYRVIT